VKLPSKPREQAAQLVAEDRFSDAKIAEICGISEAGLWKWKQRPDFVKRVEELTAIYGERVLRFGLARRERRLAVLSDMHERLLTLIDERANDPKMQDVAGGKTGLLVKTNKFSKMGKHLEVYEEFRADVGLVKELRAIEEQAARELGQWREKHELTGPDGRPIRLQTDVSNMTDEQLRERLAKLLEEDGIEDLRERLEKLKEGLAGQPGKADTTLGA
jgi:Helix-turn-helix of insertion element transposase